MPTLPTEIAVRNLSGRAVDAAPLLEAARSVLALQPSVLPAGQA